MAEMQNPADTLTRDRTSTTNQSSSGFQRDADPKRVAQYDIRREIGRGAHSMIYEAQDTQTGQEIALKMLTLSSAIAANDALGLIADFEREACIAARLSHPNIVRTYEVSAPLNRHFIVMEYLLGQTLRKRMSEGHLTPEETFPLLTQIAGALDAVHKAGIVHRDINPSNVMLLPNGTAKLYGFSNARSSADAAVMQSGIPVGSPSYMAPEQINGEAGAAATDIWALGVLSYEMLTGRLPYTGLTGEGVMFQIMHLSPAPMSDLPLAAQMVLLRVLDKRPSQRYSTAGGFIQALKSAYLRQAPETSEQEHASATAEAEPSVSSLRATFHRFVVPNAAAVSRYLPGAALLSLFLLGLCSAALVRFHASSHTPQGAVNHTAISQPVVQASRPDTLPVPSATPLPSSVPVVSAPPKVQAAPRVRQAEVAPSVPVLSTPQEYPVMQVKRTSQVRQAAAQDTLMPTLQSPALVPVRSHQPSAAIKSAAPRQAAHQHRPLLPESRPAPVSAAFTYAQVVRQRQPATTVNRRVPNESTAPAITARSIDAHLPVRSTDQSFTLPADAGGYDPEAAARLRKSAWSQDKSAPNP